MQRKRPFLLLKGRPESHSTKTGCWCFPLVKDIEIIGEAATNVSEDCREQFPHIPWRSIINMRNRLIHAYFDINLDIVWQTVTEDLPYLITELDKIPFLKKKL
jgi:uncharacterized protein with HEPN domain